MPSPTSRPPKPKKKGSPPAKKATLKPTKTSSVQSKNRGNDRRTLPVPGALLSRSTTAAAQRGRVLAALQTGPKTTHDLRCLGIYQCPARIKELRDVCGFTIETTRVTLVDRDGYSHARAGLYTLISDPPQLGLDFGCEAANDPDAPKKGSKK
ncbi:MAG: hypothetical protein EON54_22010 [Alcaligenaceae bacterium]|nr:MAG: hypothetical protein EON54_22010 [Alcaligenaceae bacterium]